VLLILSSSVANAAVIHAADSPHGNGPSIEIAKRDDVVNAVVASLESKQPKLVLAAINILQKLLQLHSISDVRGSAWPGWRQLARTPYSVGKSVGA